MTLIIAENVLVMLSHRHSRMGKNCWDKRAAERIKISCLPRDSPLNRLWPWWILPRQIKKSIKYIKRQFIETQASFFICLHSGNLLEGLFPFILHKYSKISYLLLLNTKAYVPTLIRKMYFPYFLPTLTPALTCKLKLLVNMLVSFLTCLKVKLHQSKTPLSPVVRGTISA